MVIVTTDEGLLEGKMNINEYGGAFFSFKGIPYARPPLGDLRFKAPEPPIPWVGIRQAKEFGPACIQYNFITNQINGSEDCLYLNVYTPDMNPSTPLPVMVWVHGGGFMWGSGNDDFYGPDFLIRHGVVLVTFNYRLEALGFLCLDTEDIPGNAGMKDQVAALKWVKNNIHNFGGDPDNITIFGESAGGASVSYHLISPMTKGLFKRAIIQSGSILCPWSYAFEPKEKALVLAKQLGCDSEDDKELYDFFKSQPVEKLIKLNLPVITNPKLYDIDFAIVDEKKFSNNERFFHGDLIEALKNNVHEGVDVIIGYTKDEGLLALIFPECDNENIFYLANNYLEFFTPSPIKRRCPVNKQLLAGRMIKKFYFKNNQITPENKDEIIRYMSWDMFNYGLMLQRDILATTNSKLYVYKFCCTTERNVFSHFIRISKFWTEDKDVVCHADDLFYLFDSKIGISPLPKLEINSETFKIIDRVTKLWTNFAKYGNPTPDDSLGAIWKPYTSSEQDYLIVDKQLVADSNPDHEEYAAWRDTFREHFPEWTL